MTPPRVLTGYRPTGPMHVGHWFGNVLNLLRLQETGEAFYFIADWHMLTTHFDRTDELPGYVRTLVLDLLATGDRRRLTIAFNEFAERLEHTVESEASLPS